MATLLIQIRSPLATFCKAYDKGEGESSLSLLPDARVEEAPNFVSGEHGGKAAAEIL
jgi:hypothetical protein